MRGITCKAARACGGTCAATHLKERVAATLADESLTVTPHPPPAASLISFPCMMDSCCGDEAVTLLRDEGG